MKFEIKGSQNGNGEIQKFISFLRSIKDSSLWYYKGLLVEIDPTVDVNDNNVLVRWIDVNEGFNDKVIFTSLLAFRNDFTLQYA